MLRDVSRVTASMRRAWRALAESRAEAARQGTALDAETELFFEHLMRCPDCIYRQNCDPELCEALDAEMDALDGAEHRAVEESGRMSDSTLACPRCGADLHRAALAGRDWLVCTDDICHYVRAVPAAHEVARAGGERLPGIDEELGA